MTTLAVVQGENVKQGSQHEDTAITLNVGTRKSQLALVQTDMVVKALAAAFPQHVYAIKARDTAAGDVDKVTPFKDMPVKNIWTHELEVLLTEKQLDFLVHSLKDVPTQLPPNCRIGGVLSREDPRDVFVLKAGRKACSIAELPAGSVIGTSSIRRTAQIALRFPHLVVKDIRGNVPTRLSKLDAEDGPFDAIVIAAAGLLRLNLGDRITQYLDSKSANFLYAVGQGAIGIENRSDDHDVQKMISEINHTKTYLAISAERSLLRTIEGGCSAPLGVETNWTTSSTGKPTLEMKAIVVSVDGKEYAEIEMVEEVSTFDDAEAFGFKAATEILSKGADKILAEIKAKKPTTPTDLMEK